MYYVVTELERRPYGYDTIEEAVEDAEAHFPLLSWEIRDEYEEVVYTHYVDEENEEDEAMTSHNAFRIIKTTSEIKVNPLHKRESLYQGCTLDDEQPEVIRDFSSREDALEALKAYKADVRYFHAAPGLYANVTEYSVESYTADEDGEFVMGSDYDPCEWPESIFEEEE